MEQTSRTFRVFISSTFSDLKAERNALQECVFPRLRELCAAHGARFQAVDLRWGVSQEAARDQQTMDICLSEILRCQEVTPRPNFIVLLGDRYGWRPPPSHIPSREFGQIVEHTSREERALLDEWYLRDDNAVPAEHVLQPWDQYTYEEWEAIETRLHQILEHAAQAAGLDDEARFKYWASATHQEIAAGALQVEDADEHVCCFFRTIQGLPHSERAHGFVDLDLEGYPDREAQARLEQLWQQLRKSLPGGVHDYGAAWTDGGVTTDHLDQLCEDVYKRLSTVIRQQIQKLTKMMPLDAEIAAHRAFGEKRAEHFVGRAAMLERLAAYLDSDDQKALAIWGESGTGKSALLAKAVGRATISRPTAAIVHRFIGATPNSSNGRALLESLCGDIARRYDAERGTVPAQYPDLVADFRQKLALAKPGSPLIIFVDALDQLGEGDRARSLDWLPAELPEHVSIVVATLPGACLSALRSKLPEGSLLRLEQMPASEGSLLLEQWISDARRTLTSDQRKEVLDRFSRCGLPLYLRLALEEARRWRSYDPIPAGADGALGLPADVQGMIRDLFWRLSREENHGAVLVSRALTYLGAARNGLAEDELVDVLSADGQVMADFFRRSPRSPKVDRLPAVFWSRLYTDLEPYLALRAADGTSLLGFYHRQLAEVIRADFLGADGGRIHHRALARYFGDQPLRAQERPNLRKLAELPYQQAHAGMADELADTLSDFPFMQTTADAVGPMPLIEDYDLIGAAGTVDARWAAPSGHAPRWGLRARINQALTEVRRHRSTRRDAALHETREVLRLAASAVEYDSAQLRGQLFGRMSPADSPQAQRILGAAQRWAGSPWLRPLTRSLEVPGGPLLLRFTHSDRLAAMAVSPDGSRLVSLMYKSDYNDCFMKIWDLRNGAELHTLTDRCQRTTAMAIAPDGRRAVSGHRDGSIRLWDLDALVCERTLSGHSRAVTSVAVRREGRLAVTSVSVTRDGGRALSASHDGTLRLWDLNSGLLLLTLAGDKDRFTTATLMADDRHAISGSQTGMLRVWDLQAGRQIRSLAAHKSAVLLIAATPDMRRAVTCSSNGTFISWDLKRWQPQGQFVSAGVRGEEPTIWGGPLAVTNDGRWAFFRVTEGVDVVDLREARDVSNLPMLHTEALAVTAHGRRMVSASAAGSISLWDIDRIVDTSKHASDCVRVLRLAVIPGGGGVVSGSADGTLRVWHSRCGKLLRTVPGHTAAVSTMAATRDGRRFISGSIDGTLHVWDLSTWKLVRTIKAPILAKWRAVLPSARLAVSVKGGSLGIWDLTSGSRVRTIRTGAGVQPRSTKVSRAGQPRGWSQRTTYISGVCISADGRCVVSTDGYSISVWDVRTGKELLTMRSQQNMQPRRMAVTPDGRKLISGGLDRSPRVWDLERGEELFALEGHDFWIADVAVLPRPLHAATAAEDGTLRVWDMEDGDLVAVFTADQPLTACAVAPDEPFIATADISGKLHLLRLENG